MTTHLVKAFQSIRATRCFPIKTRFDCDAAGLQAVLDLLADRETPSSWDFDIPDNLVGGMQGPGVINGPFKHLIRQHGEITIDHLRAYDALWINGQTRGAQNNVQLVECLLASLSMTGRMRVNPYRDEWTINDFPLGISLLEVIIRESSIDTNATTRILRQQLSDLPVNLERFRFDITKLNAFVITTVQQLNACGETTTELLPNLFKGYMAAGDELFVKYITDKQTAYDEGQDTTY